MLSRRGILGLFGVAALPVAIEAKPTPTPTPKPTFLKGQVMPRIREYVVPGENASHTHSFNPGHSHGYTQAHVVRHVDYEIFDGNKFVPLQSEAGLAVISDLS
jgi:hypothetical protein